MLSERLQVLIDRDQRDRLEREAQRRGASVATLVREAIDEAFPPGHAARRAAAAALLDAEPMEVPPVADLLDELDELRGQRA
ncbi:MAG TPA: CopG family transcriptional regulator [Iamia sp.]|nr:CopG family transcriptional regulator [Iamia sp.]